MRPSKYDNVARSAENAQSGHSNGIPVLKKGRNSANWQQRLKFLGIILEFHPYKRKNVFEKLNHICFVTWALIVNPKIQVFVISLAGTKMEKYIFVAHIFS